MNILQSKITFTIPISTSNYTSKQSVHFTKKQNQTGLVCCAFLLDFFFSRMKKENSIKFSNYSKQEIVPRAISELFRRQARDDQQFWLVCFAAKEKFYRLNTCSRDWSPNFCPDVSRNTSRSYKFNQHNRSTSQSIYC